MYLRLVVIRETLAFEYVNEMLLLIHTTEEPSDEDWDAMVKHAYAQKTLRGTVVLSPGAKPKPTMRSDIRSLHDHFGTKTAVITTSVVSKGVMTALSWFNVPIKGFSPDQIPEALAYLGREDMLAHVRNRFGPYLEMRRPAVA
jgi:hypothetical protein